MKDFWMSLVKFAKFGNIFPVGRSPGVGGPCQGERY